MALPPFAQTNLTSAEYRMAHLPSFSLEQQIAYVREQLARCASSPFADARVRAKVLEGELAMLEALKELQTPATTDDTTELTVIHTLSAAGEARSLIDLLRAMTPTERLLNAFRYSEYLRATYGIVRSAQALLRNWDILTERMPWEHDY